MTSYLYKPQYSLPITDYNEAAYKIYNTSQSYRQLYPNEILENLLFLGDANHASSKFVISNLKITHVANITDTIENVFESTKKVQYLRI